jgi:hypothetical protein
LDHVWIGEVGSVGYPRVEEAGPVEHDGRPDLRSIAFDACNVYVNTQAAHSVSSSIWGAPLPQGSPTSADDASALACDEEGDTDASTADADEQ